jgi:hypothetical protein
LKPDVRIFFTKAALFLLPVCVVIFLFEAKLAQIPNTYNTKRKHLENQLQNIDVLITGSSQSLNSENPDYFEYSGFNLSNGNQTLFYDNRLTLKYVDSMPRLKCVLINLCYISLGNDLFDNPESWRDFFYYQFWGIKYPQLNCYDPRMYSKISLYGPAKSIELANHLFKDDLAKNLHSNGWAKNPIDPQFEKLKDSTSLDIAGKERAEYHEQLIHEERIAQDVGYLEQLVTELKKRNVKVAIITTPVFYSYSNHLNQAHLKRDETIILSLCKKHNCVYYNYLNDNRFSRPDFSDICHLNNAGAEKFSKIVNLEVLKPLISD